MIRIDYDTERGRAGTSEYFVNFEHRELDGSDVRIAPTYGELAEALISARWGFESQQFKASAVDYVNDVLKRLDYSEKPSHCTVCKITKRTGPDSRAEIAVGHAYTNKDDNFCRQTGRWYSLTRALEQLTELPGDDSPRAGHVLSAYFGRYGNQFSCQRNKAAYEADAFTRWYLTEYQPATEGVFDVSFKESLRDANAA